MGTASLPALIFLSIVMLQRLSELVLARRNTERLLSRGGREVGAGHYPVMVALHACWLAVLILLGWRSDPIWEWVLVYIVLQAFRVWILASLGARWTTRIIIIDEPLVRRGPYRFLPHPNYLLVVAELFEVPMALGLPVVAVVFSILNLMVLNVRIDVENKALREPRKA